MVNNQKKGEQSENSKKSKTTCVEYIADVVTADILDSRGRNN